MQLSVSYTIPSPPSGDGSSGSGSSGGGRREITEKKEDTTVRAQQAEPKTEQKEEIKSAELVTVPIKEEKQEEFQKKERETWFQRTKKFFSITGKTILAKEAFSNSKSIIAIIILLSVAVVGIYEEKRIAKRKKHIEKINSQERREETIKQMIEQGKNIKDILLYSYKMKWNPREVKLYYIALESQKYIQDGKKDDELEKIFLKDGFTKEMIELALNKVSKFQQKKSSLFNGLFKNKPKKTKDEIRYELEKAGFKVKESTKSSKLLNALQELEKIGNIEGSAAISRDGLIIASNIPHKTGAEKFSATSALMIKSAETALTKLDKGKLNHIIINSSTKKVIATTAGNKAILVCLVRPRGNIGLMLLEIKKIADGIANILE